MSLIGVKDLDFLLSENLDEESLLSLSHLNQYYYHLFDNSFFSNRYNKKYQVSLSLTKQTYFESEKVLKDESEEAINYTFSKDRVDLLKLVCSKISMSKKITNYFYMDLAVEKDAIKCFKYLLNPKTKSLHYVKIAIKNKSNKILQFLFDEKMIEQEAQMIYYACVEDSSEIIKLIKEKIGFIPDNIIEEVIYSISYTTYYVNSWCKTYNSAFAEFISNLNHEKIQKIKSLAIERNCFHVIKLVTKYTSPFSEFSNKK